MIIIIKNIHPDTQISEIQEYVAPVLKRSFPFKSGKLMKAEILMLRDKRTKAIEFHGLVFIEPEKLGHRALIKLKGKRIHNKLVSVKEYVSRDWHNDRRVKHNNPSTAMIQKRIGDRRRGNNIETIKHPSALFMAVNPARKLI